MFARRPSAPEYRADGRSRRGGAAAVEALFIIPLLTLVFLGGVGIADLLITEQIIDDAAAKAARVAAMGGSEERVRRAAFAALGDRRAEHAEVTVRVLDRRQGQGGKAGRREQEEKETDEGGRGDRDDRSGGRPGDDRDESAAPGQLIEVRVSVPARFALVTRLAPLSGRTPLVGRAVIQRE